MHSAETKTEKKWKFYATDLPNKLNPWKSLHRINWRIFLSLVLPTSGAICGIKAETSGLKSYINP
jgi:hypothetical protein